MQKHYHSIYKVAGNPKEGRESALDPQEQEAFLMAVGAGKGFDRRRI